jgi:ubiquinol-cytochrome c reductase cytochrome b subunit
VNRATIRAWLTERVGGARAPATISSPSFAYVAGWVLVMLLAVEAVTGAALAAFYSPSTTDAWASVAYIQDSMSAGWLVRGLHYHGASALVIVAGLHLVQTAIWGSHRRPRELVWWLGIALLLLVLAFAVTGYVLRWDQAGYWANQVEIGIAAGTPVVGGAIKSLAIGGNDYGNLTLTRFYALHVTVLPAIVTVFVVWHVLIARRIGATPHWRANATGARGPGGIVGTAGVGIMRWPQQALRNVIAMAVVFAALLAYIVSEHGADLAAPADPTSAYDARPLWYFRWLFAMRHLAGSAEQLVALVVPALLMGFLLALPLIDRHPDPHPRKHVLAFASLIGVFAFIGALTLISITADTNDEAYNKRVAQAEMFASRMRALAKNNGVPATGPGDLLATQPMYRARELWARICAGCHDAGSKDRKGPVIAPGHGTRANLKAFLLAPSSDPFWGRTKLAKTEDAMKPVELPAPEIDDLVETLYAETGASDVDKAKLERGKALFANNCTDCHSLDAGVAGGSGPGLAGLKSRDWFTSYIGNSHAAVHMGDKSEMPRFDRELTIVERDLLAEYLVWLRTASPQDLTKLGPL